MKKSIKTNVCRLLDAAGIAYETLTYEVDESDLSVEHVAQQLGLDAATVFKTLVLRGDRTGLLVCVVPGGTTVDLKKAATASGNKKVEMLHQRELLPTTGYIRGGCSPIGMKKPLPTFIDETCELWDAICVSAGQRGVQVRLSPGDLINYVGATVVDLTEIDNNSIK